MSFTLGLATAASAQKFDKDIRFSDFSPVFVIMVDNATNGCWTIIGEAKTYTIDQINLAGGTVTEDASARELVVNVSVRASRMSNGMCLGLIQITTYDIDRPSSLSFGSQTKTKLDGVLHLNLFSDHSQVAMIADNFNTFALDTIKEAIDEWK